jgi:uncharacterized protein YbdZ (MbtH family)
MARLTEIHRQQSAGLHLACPHPLVDPARPPLRQKLTTHARQQLVGITPTRIGRWETSCEGARVSVQGLWLSLPPLFSSFTKYRVDSKFLQFSNSNSLESFNQTCLQSKGLKLIDYHFYHLNNVAQDLSIWNLACGRPSPWTWGHNGHAHSVCQYISNYVIFQTLKSKLNIQTNFSLRKHCWYSLHMVHTIHFASS